MKKILLLLLMTGAIASISFAQDQKDAKHKMDKAEWDKKVKTELSLTADQVAKYDVLSKEYGDKMEAISSDASLTKDVQKERKMALKKEKEEKLFEFITPEQQTKYKEMADKKKEAKPSGS